MKILWNKIRSNLWNSKWLNTWKEHSIILANYVPAQGAELNSFLLIWTCFLFLSDTGTTPPESGIFGFMINFSAFLGKYTVKQSEVKSLSCVQLLQPHGLWPTRLLWSGLPFPSPGDRPDSVCEPRYPAV